MSRGRKATQPVPAGSQAQIPGDFPQRLLRLKDRSGLTWDGMAAALGVDTRQLLRWRRGASPSGGAMFSLARLAASVPGGMADLLGEEPAADAQHGNK